MIATIHVTLDKPRVLMVGTRAHERMKAACGVDLLRGDTMRTHHERCCFVWSMIEDATLKPEDLAPFLTLAKFSEIVAELERVRVEVRETAAKVASAAKPTTRSIWFSRS